MNIKGIISLVVLAAALSAPAMAQNPKSTTAATRQCKAITQKGTRCKMECVKGSDYCRVHSKSNPNAAKCKAVTMDGKRCSRAATKGGYCSQHYKQNQKKK